MKILFLVPYPLNEAPSQRFRFEQYLSFLREKNIEYTIAPFWQLKFWKILYSNRSWIKKTFGLITGFSHRILILTKLQNYKYIFIHREASPMGPPIFEWIISKVFKKKIIFDFDDATWLENVSDENKVLSKLKYYTKIKSICSWSYKISCGNNYLCQYSINYNSNVTYNPTTIDTDKIHNKLIQQNIDNPNVGWTGTATTLQYLNPLIPVLKKLSNSYKFKLCIIANKLPKFELEKLEYIAWNKNTEIDDLLKFHIGVMPLPDTEWAKGKCGFKLLQYMSLGMPALASPVGVNTKIIDHGINGFLCSNTEEWETRLIQLLTNTELRIKMGKAAREKVIKDFSVLSNKDNFLSLFE